MFLPVPEVARAWKSLLSHCCNPRGEVSALQPLLLTRMDNTIQRIRSIKFWGWLI